MRPMSAGEERPLVVLVTHPREGAHELATRLVERRLAACVNLLAAASVYRWQGEVESAEELLLVVKTTAGRIDALERALAELHPYDVPECVALEPAHVEARYLAWLRAESGPATGDEGR
jgi:periplasmic divalent cation tolerance protein